MFDDSGDKMILEEYHPHILPCLDYELLLETIFSLFGDERKIKGYPSISLISKRCFREEKHNDGFHLLAFLLQKIASWLNVQVLVKTLRIEDS